MSRVDYAKITVVCTGRRRHPAVSFGTLEMVEGEDVPIINLRAEKYLVDVDPDWSDPDSVTEAFAVGVHTTFTMTCRRCQPARRVPLTRDTITKLAQGLVGAGERRLDISALDRAKIS